MPPNKPFWDENEMISEGYGAEILALGDSWFWYPANNLLSPISRWVSPPRTILALGNNGAEAQEYVHDYYLDNFVRCLKTYTNIADTKDGKRIRVRVGPFASRSEADKAAEKIKGLDLPAAVLTL